MNARMTHFVTILVLVQEISCLTIGREDDNNV
jgi:hypothetical protein